MPKKKLTKMQVRKKMLTAVNALYALAVDQLEEKRKRDKEYRERLKNSKHRWV